MGKEGGGRERGVGASVDKIWTALATSGRATAIKCIRKWPQLARSGTDIYGPADILVTFAEPFSAGVREMGKGALEREGVRERGGGGRAIEGERGRGRRKRGRERKGGGGERVRGGSERERRGAERR